MCVPTTAGTGSEVTIAALITDEKSKSKKLALTPFILPDYAFMDSEMLRSLPKHMVSASGLDALTHAFESYMSVQTSSQSRKDGLEAMKLIYENLEKAYTDGEDMVAKENMLIASHKAGLAFTRSNVGWVHAIAHQFGGIFHVNHGLANSVILPKIARFYLGSEGNKYKEIADYIGLSEVGDSKEECSKKLVNWIESLASRLDIPGGFSGLNKKEAKNISERAFKECVTTPYQPPKYFRNTEDLTKFVSDLFI